MPVKASGANANLRLRGTAGDSETDINEEINGESTDANANVSLATLSTGVGFDTTDGGHKMSEFFGYSSGPACTTETWDILNETTIPTKALYTLNGNSKDTGESGYIGQGAIFNGSSSYITSSLPKTDIANTFSVSFWWNPNTLSGYQSILGHYQDVGNIAYGWQVVQANNKIGFYWIISASPNTSNYFENNTILQQGQWYHIVATITPTSANLYVDKSSASSSPNQGSDFVIEYSSNPPFYMGRQNGSNAYYANGKIDQVRIFNKAISASEVTTLASETYASSTKSTTDIFGDNSGLALYEFEGNADDTSTTYDGTDTDVKYGLDGADSNITYTTGLFGNAASFNGSSSYIYNTNTSIWNPTWTISLWFKTSNNSGRNPLFVFGRGSWTDGIELQAASSNTVSGSYAEGTKYFTKNVSTDLDDGNFHHYCATYDSSTDTAKLYIDGNEETGLTTGTGNSRQGSGYRIGRFFQTPEQWATGSIDQVRIFDKALSSDQVKTLYNEPTATPYGIYIDNSIKTKAYFPLNAHGSSVKSSSTAIDAGQSAVFNGSNSTITSASQVIPNGASSISFWYNPSGTTGTEYIIGQGVATASKGITVYYYNSTFGALVTKGTSALAGTATTTTTYSNTAWHHVVATWDGTTNTNSLKVYVNGTLEAQGTINTSSASIGAYTYFAMGGLQGGTYAEGKIDQLKIYSSVLSSSDVINLYNETNVPTANLVAHYKLDGNGNDATGNYNASSISNITYSDPALIGDEPSYNAVSLTGVTFDQGKFNRAAVFNGSTSEIVTDLKNSDLSTLGIGDFSVSFWVYQNATASHAPLINGYKASNNGWYIELVNGKIYTFIGQDGSVAYRRGYFDVTLNLREWYHIVYDNKNNRVWLNGTEITSTFVDDSYLTVTTIGDAEINIGRQDQVNNYWFNGAIDQVRFVEGSITKEDVTKLYDEFQCDCNTNTVDFPTTNLAFYKLDGNTNDSTSNGYNATNDQINGYGKGIFGTAAIFNGSTSNINLPNLGTSVSGSSPRTISAWINIAANPSVLGTIYSSGASASLSSYSMSITSSRQARISSYNCDWISTETIALNTWAHVAIVYRGGAHENPSNADIYINGSLATKTLAGTATGVLNTSNSNYALGYFKSENNYFFNGKIDQIRIFNDALTDLQVAKLFNTTPCISSSVAADILGDNSVVAFYSMDDVYTDSTGSYTGSSNGTLSFVDGKTNKALKVSTDTQGYIQTNLNWLSGDSVSLSFWFKADSTSDYNHTIFYADPNPGQSNENSAFIGNYTGTYNNEIVSIGGWTSSGLCLYSAIGTSSTQLYDNQWHFIVFTIGSSSTDKKIYVDGVKQTIQNGSAFGSSLSRPVEFRNIRIGAYTSSSEGYAMDNFRFYNKVLSDAEVLTIYNAEL